MKTTRFPLFHKTFPPAPSHERETFVPARHDQLAANVPAALAEEWRNFGFGAYGGGLAWIPVPDEPFLDPDAWDVLDGTGIEVLRTAFADICVWQGGDFVWLNIHSGKSFSFYLSAEILFDSTLIEKNFRKSVLRERLFQQSCKLHGNLSSDECFGFAPLPALGGAIAEEYVIKTKMRPYAALVAQVIG
jgi:hypothetical protein